jgi:hypothetical protein
MRKCVPFWLLLLTLSGAFAQKKSGGKPADAPTDYNAYFKAAKWRNIGPFRGGRSVAGSGVIGNTQTYYIGYTGGGVWKTEDAGITWKNLSDGKFKTSSVGAIAVAESDPMVVYVGMGEHAPRGVMTSYGDGVYKSYPAHFGHQRTPQKCRRIVRSRPGCPARRFVRPGCVQIDRRGQDLEEGVVRR